MRSPTSPADDAHAALTALHGIGPWTADIYLLSCLGHADAWPAGDLALQEAARVAFGLRNAADREGDGPARRSAGGRGARSRRACCGPIIARSRSARACCSQRAAAAESRRRRRQRMAAELDGPRLAPKSGAGAPARRVPARLRRRRQRPDRDRPRLAGAAAAGRLRLAARAATRAGRRRSAGNGFRLTFRDPNERWLGVNKAAPGARSVSSTPSSRATSCRRRRWRWSASARAR